jgi:hypothetical protein
MSFSERELICSGWNQPARTLCVPEPMFAQRKAEMYTCFAATAIVQGAKRAKGRTSCSRTQRCCSGLFPVPPAEYHGLPEQGRAKTEFDKKERLQ